jgi:hypothetical protein
MVVLRLLGAYIECMNSSKQYWIKWQQAGAFASRRMVSMPMDLDLAIERLPAYLTDAQVSCARIVDEADAVIEGFGK